jgi:hypothetical protein
MAFRTSHGDVLEVVTPSGRRSWVQYVAEGRIRQLVRVFVGQTAEGLGKTDLESRFEGEESYCLEIEWNPLRKSPQTTYIGSMPVPAGYDAPPPMRLFVAKSKENPDGWMIKDTNGENHSGVEYQNLHPSVDQSSLSVTDVPMTDTFLEMLDTGWTPRNAKTFILG